MTICTCYRCRGTGVVHEKYGMSGLINFAIETKWTCPVCEGTGKLVVVGAQVKPSPSV